MTFDDDFNYGTKYNIWSDFMDSPHYVLEVRTSRKSTFVAAFHTLIPRIDIAIDFLTQTSY